MSTYLVLLQQDGGCDYTIACGLKWVYLKSRDMDAARQEAKTIVLEYTGDQQLSFAVLIEASYQLVLPVSLWYMQLENEKENEQIKRDNAEFERLKKKLKK